jgi:hypothetical protein
VSQSHDPLDRRDASLDVSGDRFLAGQGLAASHFRLPGLKVHRWYCCVHGRLALGAAERDASIISTTYSASTFSVDGLPRTTSRHDFMA